MNDYKNLKGRCKDDEARLFSTVCAARTRGHEHKLEHKRFHLNISKNFFTVQTEHWHRLPRDVVESASLGLLNTCLDMGLGNLLKVALRELWGVGQDGLQRSLPALTSL